jgi:hypothetical protein
MLEKVKSFELSFGARSDEEGGIKDDAVSDEEEVEEEEEGEVGVIEVMVFFDGSINCRMSYGSV